MQQCRQTKIEDLQPAIRGNDQIAGLQIATDHTQRMRRSQPSQGVVIREPPIFRVRVLWFLRRIRLRPRRPKANQSFRHL